MESIYIAAAGHSFNLDGKEYVELKHFTSKLSMLGLNVEISSKTHNSAEELFSQCSPGAKNREYVIVVNEMQTPLEDVGKLMLRDCFGIELMKNEKVLSRVEKGCIRQNLAMTEYLERLSMIPEDSIVIRNPRGVSPGYVVTIQNQMFFFLPHRPDELFNMMEKCIIPIFANLSGKNIFTLQMTASGIELPLLEEYLDELVLENPVSVCFHCTEREGKIRISVTALGDSEQKARDLANLYAKKAQNHLLLKLGVKGGGIAGDSLLTLLREKNIAIAAAVTGKELVRELGVGMPDAFSYIVNAGPSDVREKVLEVPRLYMHEDDGLGREAAMYMAHNIMMIYGVDAGFALIMEPDKPRAAIALSALGQIKGQVFCFPEGLDSSEKIMFTCEHVLDFLNTSLKDYPDNIPESVAAAEMMDNKDNVPESLKLMRRIRDFCLENSKLIKKLSVNFPPTGRA